MTGRDHPATPPPADAPRSQRHALDVAERMADGAAVVRPHDGLFLYTNPSWDDMFGYAHGELLGQDMSRVVAGTHQVPERRAREIADALRSVGIWRGLVHSVRKSGEQFWCEASVTRFDDPEHGSAWIVVQRDESRRMADETRRDEAAELFRVLFDESTAPMLVITEDLVVREVNESFCALWGGSSHDLVGSPVTDVAAVTDTALSAELIAAAFAARRPVLATRLQLTRVGGEVIDVDSQVQALAVQTAGKRLALVTMTPCERELRFRPRSREARADEWRPISE